MRSDSYPLCTVLILATCQHRITSASVRGTLRRASNNVCVPRLNVGVRLPWGNVASSTVVRLTPTGEDPLATDRGVKYRQPNAGEAVAVLAAGVDYITATAAEPAYADLLRALGWDLVYGQAEEGNDLRPWLWKGYDGYTCGSVQTGSRSDGVLIRVSGGYAAECFTRIMPFAAHISRLDCAVTVRLPEAANPAKEAYEQGPPEATAARGRRLSKGSHIETWSEGETVYLGSRKSARFGRLYNKGLESKEDAYRDAWRWEVEFKGPTTTALARSVSESGRQSEAVLAYVWDTYAAWGLPPVWGRGADVPVASLGRPPSDDDRRLAWLATQVRPAIQRLLKRGRRADVLSALGLDEGER